MVKWDDAYRDKGLVIIQVYSDCYGEWKVLQEHVTKRGIRFPTGLDPAGMNSQRYLDKPAFPVRYLIDHKGKVVWESGPGSGIKPDEADAVIRMAIERAGQSRP